MQRKKKESLFLFNFRLIATVCEDSVVYERLMKTSPKVSHSIYYSLLTLSRPVHPYPSLFCLQFIGMQGVWWYIVGRLGCAALLYMSAK